MFTELSPLLKQGDTLVITVSRLNDTQFSLTVTPRLFTLDGERGEDRHQLNQPLALTGTAAELDTPEFAATLNRFTTSTLGLRQTIDDVEAAHKAARESKLKKPAPAAAKSSAKAAETDAAGDDNQEEKPARKAEAAKPTKPEEVTASLI